MRLSIKSAITSAYLIVPASVLFLGILFSLQLPGKYKEHEINIDNYVSQRQYELSENILEKKNLKATEDAFSVLKSFNTSAYQVFQTNSVIFQWPENAAMIMANCKHTVKSPLTLRGLSVGEVRSCLSESAIVKSAFTTTSVLPVFIVTILGLSVMAVLPLLRYKRALTITVNVLKEWNSTPEKPLNLNASDQLTSKLVALVQQGVHAAVELNSTRVQLEAQKEKSTALRHFAHDIRDPINSFMTNAKFIIGDLENTEKGNLLSYSVKRIENTIQDILNPKEISQSSKVKSSGPVDLVPVIQSFFDQKKSVYSEIDFKVTTPSRLLTSCETSDFQRILANLVNNSIEAMDKENKIISVDVIQKNDVFELHFKDNGKGISEQNIPLVFDENFTDGKQNGHGLGLYYVRRKAKSWGWDTSISSSQGIGTNVVLANITDDSILKRNYI